MRKISSETHAGQWPVLTSHLMPRRSKRPRRKSPDRLLHDDGWWPDRNTPEWAILYAVVGGLIVWFLTGEAPGLVSWTYAHTLLWMYVHVLSHIHISVRIVWR
jgi:hypothetical protein